MNSIELSLFIVGLSGLFQYSSLIIAGKGKPRVWKSGIFIGMACSGLAGFGFAKASLNPYPWETFGLGVAFMLGCVTKSYIDQMKPEPGISEAVFVERRNGYYREFGVGLVFLLFLIIVTSFIQEQKKSTDSQNTLADQLHDLTKSVLLLGSRLQSLEEREKVRDKQAIIVRIPRSNPITKSRIQATVSSSKSIPTPEKLNPKSTKTHWWQFWK